MTSYTPGDFLHEGVDRPPNDPNRGRFYTNAEILHERQAIVEEVRKYADNISLELERTKKQLQLAESLIPLEQHHTYEWLSVQPSYGGSE
jgi:hypothetical protein